MNILIIGNLGYIGPVVIDHLKKQHPNYKIYGFDIGFFSGNLLNTYRGLESEHNLMAQYYGDVRKFNNELLKDIDAVVYLAAISNDPMGKAFEEPTFEINQHCAAKIARAAKEKGVKRFVFASSCSVYGLADLNAKNENSELNPLTAYAKSKVGGEIDLNPLASANFSITCFRYATACGISPRLRLDLVLNDFVASALVNKHIEILSDGKPWRPLINVKDMARAIEWALIRKEGGDFLTINAGSDNWNYQVVDLANAVKKVLPETKVSINPNAQPDNRSYKVDFSLFTKLAKGYTPMYDLDTTIKELIAGLKEAKFNDGNFRASQLIRLKTLNNLVDKKTINNKLELV